MSPLLLLVIVAAVIAAVLYDRYAAQKRREELAALAARLGLGFDPARNGELPVRYGFLDRLARGSNRYAFNILAGTWKGSRVTVFDYHYETYSSSGKGGRRTHHHLFSFFVLHLPRAFPELLIVREGLLSKLAQAFGYDDIDFESHAFSRTFCVRSPDRKFAYDVCHARMMAYLLENPDLSVEIERDALAIGFESRLAARDVERNLERLTALRALLPGYLFTEVT